MLTEPDHLSGAKKERIIRVLLADEDAERTKRKIAELADVSGSWSREYTKRLELNGLIDGTYVVDPEGLYEKWQSIRPPRNHTTISLQQPDGLLRETDLDYALTTYKAENLHQGFLFPSRTDFYIRSEEIESWLAVIEENGMVGGGNSRLFVTDEQVFYDEKTVDGLRTVSIPQLIVDLLDEGGPCQEAAEKLIDRYHRGN